MKNPHNPRGLSAVETCTEQIRILQTAQVDCMTEDGFAKPGYVTRFNEYNELIRAFKMCRDWLEAHEIDASAVQTAFKGAK